jgi:hypothetical protein
MTLLTIAHQRLEGALVKPFTEQEIVSDLLAIHDENGDDPFIRYQEGMASKGWLRQLIAKAIVKLQRDKK